ncbi:MAG: hypothetical protein ACE5DS_08090, partial [Kiloniellaceae bacterium]
MADMTERPSASHEMGMHTEQLAGRSQQVFFDIGEEGGFTYPDAFEVDYNKRAEVDASNMGAKEINSR